MPKDRPERASRERTGLASFLKRRPLWPALLAAALIQVSHAVYYGFATIHWRTAGLGVDTIGWLWAEAVIAEVILFALATRLLGQASPAGLLIVAGVLGVLRWTVTALTVDLLALVIVQTLHAATFGLTHLATMQHLQDRARDQLASGQGLFASLLALLFGLMTPLAGWLYGHFAGAAFLVMAGLSLGAPLVLITSARASRQSR